MNCPRCHGESAFRALGEEPIGAGRWMKCMNCGHRWDAEPPGEDRMPRGPWTPEQRRKYEETIRRKTDKSHTEGMAPGKIITVSAISVPSSPLDGAIAKAEADLEALKRARDIMQRQAAHG